MNEFGEPNMGNPSVRFDEGRERVGHWPLPFNPTAPAYSTKRRQRDLSAENAATSSYPASDCLFQLGNAVEVSMA